MDALMSSMMGMGMGMDSGSDGLFRDYNLRLAQGFWYIFAALIFCLAFVRAIDYYDTWSRLRLARTRSLTYPTKVSNLFMQIYATATAICREASYPQLAFSGWASWMSPPPLGRVLLIAAYWIVVIFMMTYTAVKHDAYYWERIGFRNAWISVTQVPLVYLLASKSSLIGMVIGSSHERLNWLHRWVSRTLLVTVTVHGAFFMAEWVRADFVKFELSMMPMVKYGLGAWAVMVWTVLSSISPMRRLAYEVFVMQHIAAAAVFLWLLYVHVPAYARYNIWLAIGFIAFDRVLRGLLLVYNNFRVKVKKTCNGMQKVGHEVELEAISGDITVITVKDVHLTWKPGQHLYLWLPRLGPLESHPFTIATPYKKKSQCRCNTIQFAVRVQSGFSKRINRYAQKNPKNSLTAFVAGPYGVPPAWEAYETLILISASTGASFTLPILESILNRSGNICVQRIYFLLVVRNKRHVDFYIQRLTDALANAEEIGTELHVEVVITRKDGSLADDASTISGDTKELEESQSSSSAGDSEKKEGYIVDIKPQSHSASTSMSTFTPLDPASNPSSKPQPTPISLREEDEIDACCGCATAPSISETDSLSPSRAITYRDEDCRPDIAAFIRRPVELTGGETCVAVCGGKSLVAEVRNKVASLSDERAVHKGSGAQGIMLHVEEYCF